MARRSLRRKDLGPIERLLASRGNPERAFPSVHIAGTNGKGSVSCKIASALQHAGYKVGLYISPHIADFEERITINGQQIPKEKVLQMCLQLNDPEPNFFECATCFAFEYFKEQQVDIAVIETGLGGTLDATNVVRPVLSIITSIGLDHTEILGDSLDQIAAQKAGIIKQGTPLVLGPRARLAPILEKAKELCAPVSQVTGSYAHYEEENNAVVKAALALLPLRTDPSDLECGLKSRMPCRFERRGRFILDVAHNPDGFAKLAETLQHTFPNQQFHFIIGMNRRKNIPACLQAIEEKIKHVHFVETGKEEGASVSELEKAFCSARPYSLDKTMKNAIANAPEGIVVICGSFYIMAEAIRQIEL